MSIIRPARLVGFVSVLLLTGCFGIGPQPIAVTPLRTQSLWGGAGVGVGTAGFLGQLDLSHANQKRLIRVRLAGHTNMGGTWNPTEPLETVSELSVMAGKGRPCCGGNWGAWTLGAGLVSGSQGSSPAHEFHTVGLAGEAFLISTRLPHLSASIFANLNVEQSFAGVNVAILIGKMPFISSPPSIRGRRGIGRSRATTRDRSP